LRLWTFHPKYLDSKGLVALWREGLLTQKVLQGMTTGYRAHPQLERFRRHSDPVAAIGFYLAKVYEEACTRDYSFNHAKIVFSDRTIPIVETQGQLLYEWKHFLAKLEKRDEPRYRSLKYVKNPVPHPMFHIEEGGIRSWEKTGSSG